VSTARMAVPCAPPYPFLEIRQRSRLGRLLEQGLVDLLRAVTASSLDDDLVSLLFPLEDRARANAEPPPDFRGHGDLALCGQLR